MRLPRRTRGRRLTQMKRIHIITTAGLCLAAAALAGCSSFESRAREKADVFEALDPGTQERLERGAITVGDSEDMVYIALGEPDEKRNRTTARHHQTIWTYQSYWQEYQGSEWVGWRRVIVRDPRSNRYTVFHEPVTRDVYRERVDDRIRVVFDDGRVSEVIQKRPT